MKVLKSIIFLAVVLLLSYPVFAQETGVSVRALPYEQVHVKNDKPIPYPYVREADIMWSKILWQRIELSEKQNQILALPRTPSRNTMSLIDVLLKGIHTESLTAYKARADDAGHEFDVIMTENDVREQMGARTRTEYVETTEGYDTVTIEEDYNSAEITAYMLKEMWFFDKQRSVMDFRIIGICPIRTYYRDDDIDRTTPLEKKVFWVYYPEVRPKLAKSPVYWPYTDNMNITYDDIFQKRLFSSYIYMESNPMRRAILEYKQGLDVLVEAERIKQEIFNFEQDLWSY